jgi:cobalt/nickel transport protein
MNCKIFIAVFGFVIFGAGICQAHFLVMLPSQEFVSKPEKIDFDIQFTHPMEQGPVMQMNAPIQFGVVIRGKKENLKELLRAAKKQGKTTYQAEYGIKEPGDHVFYIEPSPYWEAAEQKMIIHYTKVVVDGMGAEDSWDKSVGFPVEIEPLVRPYGLWTGNIFRGIVRKNGNPVPFAEIEVEYFNKDKRVTIPADPFVTQVIKADINGVFAYAMPQAGWWGFAALVDGDNTIAAPNGKKVPVELGGLIWVKTYDMK